MLHVDDGYPIEIGSYVTFGHSAILHGCQIGAGALIGMGAIILNGAKIGSPAKIKRAVTEEERRCNRRNTEDYIVLQRNISGRNLRPSNFKNRRQNDR